MKNLLINMKKLGLLVVGMIFIVPACTNLDEELYSDLAAENFFTTDEENIAALGQAYSSMTHWGSHTNIWTANELSSDELVIPTRGGDWYDGGILLQLHQHEFQADNSIFNNAWNSAYGAINTVNRLIYQFSSIEGADAYEAELRAIRAFYYFHLLICLEMFLYQQILLILKLNQILQEVRYITLSSQNLMLLSSTK